MLGFRHLLVLGVLSLAGLLYTPDLPLEELKKLYADNNSQFVIIDGMEVHFKLDKPSTECTSSTNIMLVHGTSSSLHTWDSWTENLIDQCFFTLRMDLPGPNESGDYSIDYYVHFLHKLAQYVGLTKYAIAGNSLGGGIAWEYAVTYPTEVTHLILLAATGIPNNRDAIADIYHDDSKIKGEVVERLYKLGLREGNRLALVKRLNQHKAGELQKIASIEAPTLIQWGKHDSWVPIEDGHKFQNLIPNSQLIEYDAGHVPMEEIPEVTVKDVISFIRK